MTNTPEQDTLESSQDDAGFSAAPTKPDANSSAISITTLVYALQAVSFLVGITFIAAIIVNYLKRSEIEGTWLESHFRWQMRTFWFAILWSAIGFLTWVLLIGMLILGVNAAWVIYRIVRGWINLADGKPMYQ